MHSIWRPTLLCKALVIASFVTCIDAGFDATAVQAAAAEGQPLKTYDSFSTLRNDILDFISSANERVWLHTDYLTDGEIVTSLFVAKYRKIDVKVLLGRKKSNAYMSRLNYLKNQNIPVFLKPLNFKSNAVTAILIDNELIYIDGELDFMSRYKKFNAYRASPEETEAYVSIFSDAANLGVPAVAKALPLVGRKNAAAPVYSPTTSSSSGPKDAAYTYGRGRTPRPDGVPSKLPRETKWQKSREEPLQADDQAVPELPVEH